MKKILLLSIGHILILNAFSQASQQLNYQAIVRNSSGNPVADSTAVVLRFTIHDISANGTPVYSETIHTTANQFGLVNVQIGSTANLGVVNWANGTKYLQVEVKVGNDISFT